MYVDNLCTFSCMDTTFILICIYVCMYMYTCMYACIHVYIERESGGTAYQSCCVPEVCVYKHLHERTTILKAPHQLSPFEKPANRRACSWRLEVQSQLLSKMTRVPSSANVASLQKCMLLITKVPEPMNLCGVQMLQGLLALNTSWICKHYSCSMLS